MRADVITVLKEPLNTVGWDSGDAQKLAAAFDEAIAGNPRMKAELLVSKRRFLIAMAHSMALSSSPCRPPESFAGRHVPQSVHAVRTYAFLSSRSKPSRPAIAPVCAAVPAQSTEIRDRP